ncbi:MAG: RNA polymerase sigma factor [Evtepia sp.]
MSTPRKPLGEAEFNQLFHTYHKPVFLYLRTLLARRGHPPDPHLVEDLTQEAFTILWEKQESFLASPNPIGWLYVTAANLARNHLRTQQRWAACLAQVDPEFLEAQPDPRPLEAGLLNLEGVVAPEELDLLRRVYLEGYSYGELARNWTSQTPWLPGEPDQSQVRKISDSEHFCRMDARIRPRT